MSTIGSSAAGLGNVLTQRFGSEGALAETLSARSLRAPSDSSSQSASPTTVRDPSSDRFVTTVDPAHRLGQTKGYPSTQSPEQLLDEQSERISELVDRFERAIRRIKQFLRSNDVDGPAGPTELQDRMNQRIATDESESRGAKTLGPPAPSFPHGLSDQEADEQASLNVML